MAKIKKLVIASGYFNPLHKGHIEYLKRSKELGNSLIVIVNKDVQVGLKGSKVFQDELERRDIIDELKSYADNIIDIKRIKKKEKEWKKT